MSRNKTADNTALAIHPQETILFSTAARNGKASKEFSLDAIKDKDITPSAKRIIHLIYGMDTKDASPAERDMAWYYVRNIPASRRMMKVSTLDRLKSVFVSRKSRKKIAAPVPTKTPQTQNSNSGE